MIIWQGKGWLVAAIIFGCSLVANLTTNWITGTEKYWDEHQEFFGYSFLAAGMICWFLGKHLEEKHSQKIITDKKTGLEVEVRVKHTLFWIPMKWCGLLAMAGSVIIIAKNMTNAG